MKILFDLPVPAAQLAALSSTGKITADCLEGSQFDRPARQLDPARIQDAEILVCSQLPLNRTAMTALQWIQIPSTGYDQLLGLGLADSDVVVTNSRGCCDLQIAEWNIAQMINLARGMRVLLANQEAAIWDRSAAPQGEIRGETARLARQFGLRVHALTRSGPRSREETYVVSGTGDPEARLPDRFFIAGQEAEFLGGLDFLIVACPLTSATKGMIGEAALRALPRTAALLNPARGPIVQEAALLRALTEGWIAGAALDTHFSYPLPAEHPLWRMRNVILTPHLAAGGATRQFVERFWDLFGQNLGRYLAGRPLLNQLTAAELAGC